MSSRIHKLTGVAALAVAAVGLSGPISAAGAATATSTVSAGSLSFINSTPGNVAFPGVTLNGSDQTPQQTQVIDVNDATGSNSGWSISATSTTFTAGTHTLSNTATTIQTAPTSACLAASTCTLATNAISYPYVLPAATVAPGPTKMFNATVNSGMGGQKITPEWTLAIPATTWAGGVGTPYTSTWTFTLANPP